jgi:hypothetical protein
MPLFNSFALNADMETMTEKAKFSRSLRSSAGWCIAAVPIVRREREIIRKLARGELRVE